MYRSITSLALVVGLGAAATSCVIIGADDATLTIHNHSSFVLTEVRLAEVDDRSWGPNLLPDVLYPGEDVVIHDIACAAYDVLVVEETDVECVLPDLWLCFNDERWIIHDSTLARCSFPY